MNITKSQNLCFLYMKVGRHMHLVLSKPKRFIIKRFFIKLTNAYQDLSGFALKSNIFAWHFTVCSQDINLLYNQVIRSQDLTAVRKFKMTSLGVKRFFMPPDKQRVHNGVTNLFSLEIIILNFCTSVNSQLLNTYCMQDLSPLFKIFFSMNGPNCVNSRECPQIHSQGQIRMKA